MKVLDNIKFDNFENLEYVLNCVKGRVSINNFTKMKKNTKNKIKKLIKKQLLSKTNSKIAEIERLC